MRASSGEMTRLLAEVKLGNKDTLGKLRVLVYAELRHLAGRYLRVRIGHTLQPAALAHEAHLRLVAQESADWRSRSHFMGVAARRTRQTLVDCVRRRLAGKRDGTAVKLDLDGFDLGASTPKLEEIVAVYEALLRLSELNMQQGRVVELRYFARQTVEETVKASRISTRTVKRDWSLSTAWLRRELSGKGVSPDDSRTLGAH